MRRPARAPRRPSPGARVGRCAGRTGRAAFRAAGAPCRSPCTAAPMSSTRRRARWIRRLARVRWRRDEDDLIDVDVLPRRRRPTWTRRPARAASRSVTRSPSGAMCPVMIRSARKTWIGSSAGDDLDRGRPFDRPRRRPSTQTPERHVSTLVSGVPRFSICPPPEHQALRYRAPAAPHSDALRATGAPPGPRRRRRAAWTATAPMNRRPGHAEHGRRHGPGEPAAEPAEEPTESAEAGRRPPESSSRSAAPVPARRARCGAASPGARGRSAGPVPGSGTEGREGRRARGRPRGRRSALRASGSEPASAWLRRRRRRRRRRGPGR